MPPTHSFPWQASVSQPLLPAVAAAVAAYFLCRALLGKRRGSRSPLTAILTRARRMGRLLLPLVAALGVFYWFAVSRCADLPGLPAGAQVRLLGRVLHAIPAPDQPGVAVCRVADATGQTLLRFEQGAPPPGWLIAVHGAMETTPSGVKFVGVRRHFACPVPSLP
jgi:hypothetical protein